MILNVTEKKELKAAIENFFSKYSQEEKRGGVVILALMGIYTDLLDPKKSILKKEDILKKIFKISSECNDPSALKPLLDTITDEHQQAFVWKQLKEKKEITQNEKTREMDQLLFMCA